MLSTGSAVKRTQLSEEVAAYIRGSITSGRLAPGDFVRIDRVAEELGVSATPVREALVSLRTEGFVHLDPSKGFRVKPLSRQDVNDVFQLHAHIAGELASRCASVITEEVVAQLDRIQESMRSSYAVAQSMLSASHSIASESDRAGQNNAGWNDIEELNFHFHRLINKSASSPKLSGILRLLNHYVPHGFYAEISGWPEATLYDHAAIIDALKNGEPDTAREAMAKHIEHAGTLLLETLEMRGFWTEENHALDKARR